LDINIIIGGQRIRKQTVTLNITDKSLLK